MMYIAVGAGFVGIVVTGSVARWLLRRWARAFIMDAMGLATDGMRERDAAAKKSWDETFGDPSRGMILCEVCGNKRCPHARDSRYGCTGSNEPGQEGSMYQ